METIKTGLSKYLHAIWRTVAGSWIIHKFLWELSFEAPNPTCTIRPLSINISTSMCNLISINVFMNTPQQYSYSLKRDTGKQKRSTLQTTPNSPALYPNIKQSNLKVNFRRSKTYAYPSATSWRTSYRIFFSKLRFILFWWNLFSDSSLFSWLYLPGSSPLPCIHSLRSNFQ